MVGQEGFQRRLVLGASLALASFSVVAAVYYPLRVGFDAVMTATAAGCALGFAAAALMAERRMTRAASNLLIAVAMVGLALGSTREATTTTHHLVMSGFVIPVMLAFLLDRLWLGGGLVGATMVLFVGHAARFDHARGDIATISILFLAGSSITLVDSVLRTRERKRAESAEAESGRLRELNQMRMQFINTAAHDLRTPLTPLKLSLATLRNKFPDTAASKPMEVIQRNVARFELLIEDMLDAARLQAGRLVVKRAPLDLAAIVRDSVATFEEAARTGNLALDASGVQAARVEADALKASQVVMNMLSNAVKYTPAGGRVTVSLHTQGGVAELSVQDTGLGLSPEQTARLFQPFVRVHDGAAVASGTGLGLYISKGIVEAHGGTMSVHSEGPGKGARFTATFPLAAATRPAAP